MTTFKTLTAVALVSMTTVTSASAQLPSWAATNPDSFQAQYPDRDVLNGGALTPAGRMGLELPGGAAPVFGANNAYAATGRATASSCAQHYHSYDPHLAPTSPTTVVAMPVSDASSKVSLNHNDRGATATRRRMLL